VEAISYRPFGDSAAGVTRYRFTSKELDGETGLYFYGARYYSPGLGRFISPDPIAPRLGEPQGLNRYSYVQNNPLRYTDPTGNEEEDPQVQPRSSANLPIASEMADAIAGSFVGEFMEGQRAEIQAQSRRVVAGAMIDVPRMALGSYDLVISTLRLGQNPSRAINSAEPLGTTIAIAEEVRDVSAAVLAMAGVAGVLLPRPLLSSGLESRGFRAPPGTRQIPEGIPETWRIRPSRGDGGVLYYDPAIPNKANSVRVMPGDATSPYATSRSPYVRWQLNGQPLDQAGSVLPTKYSPAAHIPLSDFQFNPDLFK
jgi:RHS repeat-associated protein